MTDDQKQDENKKSLNLRGAAGQCIFWKPMVSLLMSDGVKFDVARLQKNVNEYWGHYQELTDERAIVLVGSLCVEDCLDKMIAAIFLRPEEILENKDFSLSLKIDLLQAYRIMPSRILHDCDTVRQMRNDFAHELMLKTFSEWDINISRKKKAGSTRKNFDEGINEALKIYDPAYDLRVSYRKRFEYFVGMVTIALLVYTTHAQTMRKFMDSEDFGKALVEFSKRNNNETQR